MGTGFLVFSIRAKGGFGGQCYAFGPEAPSLAISFRVNRLGVHVTFGGFSGGFLAGAGFTCMGCIVALVCGLSQGFFESH